MEKKTKVFIVLCAVIAAFIVFGVIRAIERQNVSEEKEIKTVGPGNYLKEQCSDVSGYEKEKCFSALAADTGNVSFCEMQAYENGTVYSESWRSSCYFNSAIKQKNYSLCSIVPDKELYSPDICYLNIVAITKDKNICRNIKDNSTRDDCYQGKMLSER